MTVERVLTYEVPKVNRTVAYFVYALITTMSLLALIGSGRIPAEVGLPIVTGVIGHFFGKSDAFSERKGANNGE